MAATSRLNLTLKDKDGEAGTVSVHATALVAGNFTAQMGLADDFLAALLDISNGVLFKDSRVAVETTYAPTLPTGPFHQRGIKWLVRARDTNGNPVTFHVPVAKLDGAGLLVGENLDLTSTEGAAFKSATEAFVKSNDGEAVVVEEVIYLD